MNCAKKCSEKLKGEIAAEELEQLKAEVQSDVTDKIREDIRKNRLMQLSGRSVTSFQPRFEML